MYDKPPFLRGIYTCLDYNQNPVARRILFVKLSDNTAHEDFMSMRGGLKPFADIDDDERPYFEYTCLQDDIVRMCDIPAPTMGLSDLVQEKEILRLRGRDCMPGKKH